ncbi:MAG: ferritin family protein [Pseudomonadota bacterium]
MPKNNKDEHLPDNKNLIKVFEYALNQEETGKSFFQSSLKRMSIGSAVSAFKLLIKEEEKHIVFIEGILTALMHGDKINLSNLKQIVIEPTNYFDARAKSEFLQQCIDGSMVPDVTVFNTAWLIEKDLGEFYENMSKNTDGEARKALLMLSSWEKFHEQFFREYRDKLSDIYSKMPWGG